MPAKPPLFKVEFDPDTHSYHTSVVPETLEEIHANLVNALARDRDGKIRQALIDLGWTPPDDSRPTQDAYDAACKALHHWRDEARRLAALAGVEPRQMTFPKP